ncbi:uncharacterized protein L203_101812 [Cryptococcus depauperatus CBS 7841]|uniref:Palmitoyltransferase n=1 Tax=Cryptococcus depauperatus CBS 7841 TaxID=1295531 RepID=A0AAJ8JQL9_9TREE
MVSRDWSRIWVGGTILLISFIAFTSQIFIVWPWYGKDISLDLLKLLVPFNCAVFMVFWNYRLCVVTSPGLVPKGWRPNMSSMEGMEIKRGTHAPRYCKTCQHYKPPRAHHCRQCNTCYLKVSLSRACNCASGSVLTVLLFGSSKQLDHHCPWIGNCVGFFNQGHFIRFLLWVDIATTYHLIMMVSRVMSIAQYYVEPTLVDVLLVVFNFAACIPVWLCVGMFSVYHLYLASGNSTTIEGWEKDKVATLVRRGKIKEIKYPYNIGVYHNLKAVLGPNPLFWLWPQKMQGNGLSFPVCPKAGDHNVQYFWPPQDPTKLPNPSPRPANTSPFTYGNGFNPNLHPSNSMRIRQNNVDQEQSTSAPLDDRAEMESPQGCLALPEGARHYSSGEERDDQSAYTHSVSSSPEPYLSDYDEHNEGPMIRGERMAQVRRGSEGWEVRPRVGGWNQAYDEEGAWDDEAGYDDEPGRQNAERPWEHRGRYNIYYPEKT